MLRSFRLFVVLLVLLAVTGQVAAAEPEYKPRHRYIVALSPDVQSATDRSGEIASKHNIRVDMVFESALKGFVAELSDAEARSLASEPNVIGIERDQPIYLNAQTVPTGIRRIGADQNSVSAIDGVDTEADIDVAIIDSGISLGHPDLNIAGGYNCTSANRSAYDDDNGHGTHVAGTVAARDNNRDVVGVVPGARLWSVKVFDEEGSGLVSWLICGFDWIAQNSATIEVANFSGTWSGGNSANCGNSFFSFFADTAHQAVCRLVNERGVPLIVAAGNDGRDASNTRPAAYPETIAVGAIVDSDGQPGGLGPSTTWGADDTRAGFSNFGSTVDLYAPGVNILSTLPDSTTGLASGTSMATPHVTGAASVYLLQQPNATPQQVRQALFLGGESGSWANQPLVDLREESQTPVHDVAVTSVDAPASVTQGQSVSVNVNVQNLGNVSEQITVSLSSTPSGQVPNPANQQITLGAGQSSTVSFQWATTGTTAIQSYTLTGSASISNDSNTANNSATDTISVVAPPPTVHDVAVTQVNAPSTVTQGQSANVQVTVQNLGNVSEQVTVSLGTSPSNPAANPANQQITLNAGQTTTLTFQWATSGATTVRSYTLTGAASISGDQNTANNSATDTISVVAPPSNPEVWVQNLTAQATAFWSVYRIDGRVTIQGTNGPVAYASVRLRLTGPGMSIPLTLVTLPGGQANFSMNVSQPGTYQLVVEQVTASGLTYNASRNVVSSVSVTTP